MVVISSEEQTKLVFEIIEQDRQHVILQRDFSLKVVVYGGVGAI